MCGGVVNLMMFSLSSDLESRKYSRLGRTTFVECRCLVRGHIIVREPGCQNECISVFTDVPAVHKLKRVGHYAFMGSHIHISSLGRVTGALEIMAVVF